METKKFRPYQEQGVRRIVEIARERDVILADEPGLGKTIQVAAFLNITRPDTVLVVCPASLTINWKKELNKWLEYTPGNLCVLSYSRIRRASGNAVAQWDVVVFDEAHYLKNPDAQRTKASLKIPAHRRLFLTGTPIVNRPIDLWPILSAMGTKLSKQEYGVRYCNRFLFYRIRLNSFIRSSNRFRGPAPNFSILFRIWLMDFSFISPDLEKNLSARQINFSHFVSGR